MKKFVLVVAVTTFLAACHSSASTEETSCDTTCVTDSIVVIDSIVVDTTK
jgi:hypothetical protein